MDVRAGTWTAVLRFTDLLPERGVCVLVNGRQVAVFRTHDGSLYALDNRDPYSGAYVLSRGIVGTRGEIPTVASPMLKQVFDLRSGQALDDAKTAVTTFEVRVREGLVEVLAG